MARTHSETINFWRNYVEQRGQREQDMPPPLAGRMFQGGPSKGIPEDIGYEVGKGSPADRFGKRPRVRHLTRIKCG